MLGYRVPAPDDAMLISGGKHGEGVPFRVVVGRAAFIMPFFRKVRFLTLAMQESEVQENCVTKSGIALTVKAVIAFKVGNDAESIVNAGQRFVSDEEQMPVLTGRIFAGHLRSIVGAMTVEEIIQERQRLAEEVVDASKGEMARIGLVVDSLQIQAIDDQNSGYIKAMGAKQRAQVAQNAAVAEAQASQATQIAQAEAQQAAAQAQQLSQQQQSNFATETARVEAENQAAIQTAQAEAAAKTGTAKALADSQIGMAQAEAQAKVQAAAAQAAQSGPLAQAKATQQVASEQTKLAQQEAALREQQLIAEVVKPAEADAEKVRVTAVAKAEEQTILARAAESGNRVSLDQQLIGLLPQIVEKAASGLSGANVTIFNGATGVEELFSQVIGQGMSVYDTLRKSVNHSNGNGQDPKALEDETR
jgi:flotillin